MSSIEKKARSMVARDGGTIMRTLTSGATFELTYTRTGPRHDTPVVVIPGGPGMASVVPFGAFRKDAGKAGLDIIMIEHRGVGLSGRTQEGEPLPVEEVTVESAADDVAAVMDALFIPKAIVAGASYGTYLAQAVAVRHPERIAGLVLDSPMLSPIEDLAMARQYRRSLLWHGTPETAHIAKLVRELAGAGEPMADLGMVVQVVYEFAGPDILARLLQARAAGRLGRLWGWLATLGQDEIDGPGVPYLMEPQPVSEIGFGQLGYGLPPDGGPLDPQLTFASAAEHKPQFHRAPFDLAQEVPHYPAPVLVISGDRDLRTPRPVAERIVSLAGAKGALVTLGRTGHSALDTHRLALIEVLKAARDRNIADLPLLEELPRKGSARFVGTIVSVVVQAATRRAV